MKKNSSIPKAGFRLFRPDPRMFGKLFALFIFMTFCTYVRSEPKQENGCSLQQRLD